MEQTPIQIEDAQEIAASNVEDQKKTSPANRGPSPGATTEVSQNQNDRSVEEPLPFDSEYQPEEQKIEPEGTLEMLDDFADTNAPLQKLSKDSVDGPEERIHLSQITDYSEFIMIDKFDKDMYITDEHKNYIPPERDTFILIKKSGIYQRLIWGEPLELSEKETQRWQEFL